MKLSLTSKTEIPPLKFLDDDGGEVRFTFKRRPGREERQTLLKKHGKGRKATEILDLQHVVDLCIKSVTGIEITDTSGKVLGPGEIDSPAAIYAILDSPGFPDEMFEKVIEHVMGESSLGEDEGNF